MTVKWAWPLVVKVNWAWPLVVKVNGHVKQLNDLIVSPIKETKFYITLCNVYYE